MSLSPILSSLLDPPSATVQKKPRPVKVRQVSAHAAPPPPLPGQVSAKSPQKSPVRGAGEEREPRRQPQRSEAGDAPGDVESRLPSGISDGDRHGGEDGGGSREESCDGGDGGRTSLEGGDYDAETILELLPTEGDSGIFEVVFPDGERMGVMVDVRADAAAFMMAPHSDKLRNLLCRKQMELEQRLARRMDKYVRLTVL